MSTVPPMPSFRELLHASDAELVKAFYRLPASGDSDFIKIEVHAIYTGGLATADFVVRRLSRPIGDLRQLIEEVPMIVRHALVPPGNLFFSDDLLPAEKRYLIENGHVDAGMIANRLRNSEISEDERQMLEDFV